tara:strand:+ start:234 stop:626 length:393 start_codon:yes stop_codon:yes gene_type:complete
MKLTTKQLRQMIIEELKIIKESSWDYEMEQAIAEDFSEVIRNFSIPDGRSAKRRYEESYMYQIGERMGLGLDSEKIYEMADFAHEVMRKWNPNNKLHKLAANSGEHFIMAFELDLAEKTLNDFNKEAQNF